MKNQIPEYGKSILSFLPTEPSPTNGIVDITDAFAQALADTSLSLLTIPAGNYILREHLCLRGHLFIDAHPHAEIDCCGFEGEEAIKELHIRGGYWRLMEQSGSEGAFEFSGASDLYLENMKLSIGTGIGFIVSGGRDVRIERCTILAHNTNDAVSTGLLLAGSVENLYAHTLSMRSCGMCVEISPETVLKQVEVRTLDGEDCQYLVYAVHASVTDTRIEALSGCAHTCAVHFEACVLDRLSLCDLKLHNGFFAFLENTIGSVRIERFCRQYDLDKNAATHPTLRVSGQTCALFADLVSLDSILRTQKLCPAVKLRVSRRSTPLLQPDMPFVYAFHASLSQSDSYIMPSGSFDLVEMSNTK